MTDMTIVFSIEIQAQLEAELKNIKNDVQIISAFCKESALKFIQDMIPKSVKNKRLLVRFTLSDILYGVSDASLYGFCKQYGWDMYVQFRLHAKTYIFDRKRCLIGSANATNKGIGLVTQANIEISGISDISTEDLVKIDHLFSDATKVDDNLYAKMQRDIENAPQKLSTNSPVWSEDILAQVRDEVISSIFSCEFPNTAYSHDQSDDALAFLNIEQVPFSTEELKSIFLSCRAYKWLVQILKNEPSNELYFGVLTKKLHNILISDPPPYRKEVKDLLANLLTWVDVFAHDKVYIDCPNHSQRIRLK
jgi:hypothetical protein